MGAIKKKLLRCQVLRRPSGQGVKLKVSLKPVFLYCDSHTRGKEEKKREGEREAPQQSAGRGGRDKLCSSLKGGRESSYC